MSVRSDWSERVLSRWGPTPAARASIEIAQSLASLPPDRLKVLTFDNLRRATSLELDDETLLKVVVILTRDKQPLLNAGFFYYSISGDELELGPSDLKQARRDGGLVDPITGDFLENFEERIVPFFYANEILSAFGDDR